MADKVKELEERLDRLENRIKATFLEIERRFEQQNAPAQPLMEQRIEELEDLILLIQLEITKMKDKIGGEMELVAPSLTPDVEERLHKLEQVAAQESHPKLEQIEEKISVLQHDKQHDINKTIKATIQEELDEIEKRLNRLEQKRSESILSSRSILEDVRSILSD